MKTAYTVFDYDKQQWLFGEHAMDLRREQIQDELRVLRGSGGADYARFIRADRAERIAALEMEFAALDPAPSVWR